MNLRSIGCLFKNGYNIYVYNQKNSKGKIIGQWVTDGAAAYRLGIYPPIEVDDVAKSLFLSQKACSKINFKEVPKFNQVDFNDLSETEVPVNVSPIEIVLNEVNHIPVFTENSLDFLDSKYLSAISKRWRLATTLFARKHESGQTYFAVKEGGCVIAVIMPFKVDVNYFDADLRRIIDGLEFCKKDRQ